jgi:pyruvate ferredoxin oxidoreductase beta subunit
MNTGVQRSSATPKGTYTTTSPVGKAQVGKKEFRKNLTEIMVAHNIPYVAQASPSHWSDLVRKVEKALSIKGPKFINVLMPCTLGWAFPPDMGIEIAKLAVETCFWPLYEVENGKYTVNFKPKEMKPLTEFINVQNRFSHLKKEENKAIVEELQDQVKREWENLRKKEGLTKA